jgi:hypothetical protein
MQTIRHVTLIAALSIAPIFEIEAQVAAPRQPFAPALPRTRSGSPFEQRDDRSGPRFGVAYLTNGSVTAELAGRKVAPVMSLFGWQLEHQFDTGNSAMPMPMTELVVLVGAMEQGAFLPSASWLVGMRKPSGWEAGIGPTVTGAGVQLVAAAGITHAVGNVNVPINVAVGPGRRGASLSITTGFNTHRR